MGTVLVTGGSGSLGRPLVALLRERGDDVRVLSRRPGQGTHLGDLATGEGVREALAGVDRVVHAATDSPSGKADRVQTQRLLDAAAAGVRHLLYVSIVGIDRMALGYYRRKLACEQAIEAGAVPYTILRSTQFHELLASLFGALRRYPVWMVPAGWRVQPIAAAEVAARIAELIAGEPAGRVPDVGGPEVITARGAAALWREHRGRPRALLSVPVPGRVSRDLRGGRNLAPDRAEGRQTWAEYLRSTA